MPRFSSANSRRGTLAAVDKALAKQRDAFRRDYEALVARHRHELSVLHKTLDDVLAINRVLSDALTRADEDNADLRRDLAALDTLHKVAMFRRGSRILSWRGAFRRRPRLD
jgi:hypothetical protein